MFQVTDSAAPVQSRNPSRANARKLSLIVRAAARQSGTPYPIRVTAGGNAPALVGSGWHYATRGGRRIYHPSAYARHGWSNMVYSPSTRAIEVGAEWLAERGIVTPEYVATFAGAGI